MYSYLASPFGRRAMQYLCSFGVKVKMVSNRSLTSVTNLHHVLPASIFFLNPCFTLKLQILGLEMRMWSEDNPGSLQD